MMDVAHTHKKSQHRILMCLLQKRLGHGERCHIHSSVSSLFNHSQNPAQQLNILEAGVTLLQ